MDLGSCWWRFVREQVEKRVAAVRGSHAVVQDPVAPTIAARLAVGHEDDLGRRRGMKSCTRIVPDPRGRGRHRTAPAPDLQSGGSGGRGQPHEPNLNPNAPAFIGNLFKPKSEKENKSKSKDGQKSSKAKSKGKEPRQH